MRLLEVLANAPKINRLDDVVRKIATVVRVHNALRQHDCIIHALPVRRDACVHSADIRITDQIGEIFAISDRNAVISSPVGMQVNRKAVEFIFTFAINIQDTASFTAEKTTDIMRGILHEITGHNLIGVERKRTCVDCVCL